MKKYLLICIAFHYSRDRIKYVYELINNFNNNYKCSFDIIIDTNLIVHHTDPGFTLMENVTICEHKDLTHPFHLTWMHRKHIKENIDNYDNFAYFEDDILLPYENYLNYIDNFKLLFPRFVPAMIRIEEKGGEQFVTDIIEQQQATDLLSAGGREFTQLKPPNNYNGFWIMPAKELKETMLTTFDRVHESREHAASYVAWELQKPTMVEIENGVVSEKCYSYHLPNNYAMSPESKHAKLNPKQIFK